MLNAVWDMSHGVVDPVWDVGSVLNKLCECESCDCTYNNDYMVFATSGDWINGSADISADIGSWGLAVGGGFTGSGVKLGVGTDSPGDDSICWEGFWHGRDDAVLG